MNDTSRQNSTTNRTIKGGKISYNVNLYILFLIFQFAALILQLMVQYIIHKTRLRDNQYQLIRLESIIESLHLVTAIILATDAVRRKDKNPDKLFATVVTFLTCVWSTLSAISTVIISIDRWAAVKFALRYHELVTKQKLTGIFVFFAFIDVFALSCMCFVGDVTNTILRNDTMFTSRVILAYIASLRAIACTVIIVLGKKTIQYRNQNEARIRGLNNLHGSQAEELDLMIVLKRGIKDVLEVNFWTCIFLVPTVFMLIIIISGVEIPEWAFGISTAFVTLQMTSSPVIYLSCYTKIRNVWTRLFRRQVTHDEA